MISLSLFIARRFFTTKSKASFISLISKISMIGVGVEVTALVLILSVFNGLEGFQKDLFKTYDPDFKITSVQNAPISFDSSFVQNLKGVSGVQNVIPVLEDQGLFRYKGKQMVVNLKGVSPEFITSKRLSKNIAEGGYYLKDAEGKNNFALVGLGIFLSMGLSFEDVFTPIEAWYPDHHSLKHFSLNENAIRSNSIFPAGVIAVEQGFDNQTVIVPLDWMQNLCGKEQQISSFELMVNEGVDANELKSVLQQLMGPSFKVLSRDEQHETLLKAVSIEKLFVFLVMAFVMGIASFTIFYTLSLLVIEKKKDLKTLLSMGISRKQLFRIFLFLGFLISCSGAIIGLLLGFSLGWIQEYYGIIKLGIPNGLVDAYPIQMRWTDFVATAILVILITFLASIFPAKKAVNQTFD
jgi:lipoprotein-releasing system permease protein